MKKLISFSLASLAIFAPNVALSQPGFASFSEDEADVILSFVCDDDNFTRAEIIEELKDEDDIAANRRVDVASAAMSGAQIPAEAKAAMCDD